MARIVAVAENFAFGPISKLLTITEQLLKQGHDITFIGEGTAYQLGKKQKFTKIYHHNTDGVDYKKWAKPIFQKADVLLSSGDRSSILLAQEIGLPTIWLDILFWWWDDIPEYLLNADLYIQQNSLYNGRNMKRYANKTKNMKIVGPIIDLQYHKEKLKNQLLIAFGGMEAAGWYQIGKDSNYPYTISQLIINKIDTSDYKSVLFVGNERITKDLSKKYGTDKFRFVMLPHNEMLYEMARSEDILMVPGLETPLEAFAYNQPIFFLPPSNSSQYVQLDEFRKFKLATKINSIHFADYYPYKNLAGKNLRHIMEVFLKELSRFEHSDSVLESCAERINNYLHQSKREKLKQIDNEKKFIASIGGNGLKESVSLINKFITAQRKRR